MYSVVCPCFLNLHENPELHTNTDNSSILASWREWEWNSAACAQMYTDETARAPWCLCWRLEVYAMVTALSHQPPNGVNNVGTSLVLVLPQERVPRIPVIRGADSVSVCPQFVLDLKIGRCAPKSKWEYEKEVHKKGCWKHVWALVRRIDNSECLFKPVVHTHSLVIPSLQCVCMER